MKKSLAVFAPFVLVMGVLMFMFSLTNNASATGDETCVPQEAQHYSWTGGRLPTSTPPTEVPPSDNWQANTHLEPHTQGGGHPATWVNESLHYTANSQGHASWFYFTPEVVCEEPTTPVTDPPYTEPTTEPPVTTEPPTTTEPPITTEPPTTTVTTTTEPTTPVETTDTPTLAPPVVSTRPPVREHHTPPADLAPPAVPTEIEAGL